MTVLPFKHPAVAACPLPPAETANSLSLRLSKYYSVGVLYTCDYMPGLPHQTLGGPLRPNTFMSLLTTFSNLVLSLSVHYPSVDGS